MTSSAPPPPGPPLARDQFPVAERWTYLDHPALAPLPAAAVAAARRADNDWMRDGGAAEATWEHHAEGVRGRVAQLMGATGDEVAFVKNTTEGLAFVARGLPWAPGDRVVVADGDYPSTLFPFLDLQREGVEVVRVAPVGHEGGLRLDTFAAALAAGPVRLVVVSWVQYTSGWRTDVAALTALAHEHGALVCVDLIQGLGVLPCRLDAWGVDAATADGHKWLLGPQGAGVLYVARRHLDTDTFRPMEPGWNSVVTRDDYAVLDLAFDPDARRFEGGTLNLTGIAALGASVDLLADAGIEAVWTHVDSWCQQAADELRALGARVITTDEADHRSGIVTFTVPGPAGSPLDPGVAYRELVAAGVACRARGGGVRIGPHGWNNDDDLAALVRAVHSLR